MAPSALDIQSFLRLGYFIGFDEAWRPIDFSKIDKARYAGLPKQELMAVGAAKIRSSISELFEPGAHHIVPISGGLDSRLILAVLLEHTEASRIETYTFGVPGAYDFDLGSRVAQVAGTRHHAFSYKHATYDEEELLDVARRTGCQAVLFYHPPMWTLDRMFSGATIWSGYVGDAVAGSHLHDPQSRTLDEAKQVHLAGRTFVRSMKLHTAPDEEFLAQMGGGRQDPDQLSWDEQVLFDEAVAKFTAPLVLIRGFEYQTPLINTPWMDFMFSVPPEHRLGETLMIDLARASFPKLFDLPSKNRLGLSWDTPDAAVRAMFWVNRARKLAHRFVPSVNYPNHLYNDYDEELRQNQGLREIVRAATRDLQQRGVVDWLDIDGIWRRHDRRLKNHGDVLMVLASLSLVLRARERAGR